eukprot:COSAG02_NODE_43381_length_375_cov_0.938406_1_plen_60_part_10
MGWSLGRVGHSHFTSVFMCLNFPPRHGDAIAASTSTRRTIAATLEHNLLPLRFLGVVGWI